MIDLKITAKFHLMLIDKSHANAFAHFGRGLNLIPTNFKRKSTPIKSEGKLTLAHVQTSIRNDNILRISTNRCAYRKSLHINCMILIIPSLLTWSLRISGARYIWISPSSQRKGNVKFTVLHSSVRRMFHCYPKYKFELWRT